MREWITELTKSLFSENVGLFKQTNGVDDCSYFPNSKAKLMYQQEYKDFFRFAGQVLAKALFEKIPILIKINRFLLKKLVKGKIVKSSISYEDLKDYDY